MLGATDRRLRCVVAQVPTISGYEQGSRRVSPTPRLRWSMHSTRMREPSCAVSHHAARRLLAAIPPFRPPTAPRTPSIFTPARSGRPVEKRGDPALHTGRAHVRARQLDFPRFADAAADGRRTRRQGDCRRSGARSLRARAGAQTPRPRYRAAIRSLSRPVPEAEAAATEWFREHLLNPVTSRRNHDAFAETNPEPHHICDRNRT